MNPYSIDKQTNRGVVGRRDRTGALGCIQMLSHGYQVITDAVSACVTVLDQPSCDAEVRAAPIVAMGQGKGQGKGGLSFSFQYNLLKLFKSN